MYKEHILISSHCGGPVLRKMILLYPGGLHTIAWAVVPTEYGLKDNTMHMGTTNETAHEHNAKPVCDEL